MNDEQHQKVKAGHLARDAYLYVRQATCCQRFEDADRLERQYHLRQQALALGWPAERVIVIDSDIGRSGASATDRPGFQALVRQVRQRCVGIVMASEPSRLTRNFVHWRDLLDACARSNTLLLHEGGLYDPGDSRDRVLLGCDQTTPVRTAIELTLQHKEALT
jgi:DNA invertase Pin-like site-specific DNA recombinase